MKNFLAFPFLIRVGLACVFLANSMTAFFDPSEFQDLVSNSFVVDILNALSISVSTFVTFVGVNDLTVAVLLFIGWRTPRVATYAIAWLTGVILMIGVVSLDALEHLAFLAMAATLALRKGPTA